MNKEKVDDSSGSEYSSEIPSNILMALKNAGAIVDPSKKEDNRMSSLLSRASKELVLDAMGLTLPPTQKEALEQIEHSRGMLSLNKPYLSENIPYTPRFDPEMEALKKQNEIVNEVKGLRKDIRSMEMRNRALEAEIKSKSIIDEKKNTGINEKNIRDYLLPNPLHVDSTKKKSISDFLGTLPIKDAVDFTNSIIPDEIRGRAKSKWSHKDIAGLLKIDYDSYRRERGFKK